MTTNTVYSSGKNNFKNLIFSEEEWSAPKILSPVEARKLIDSFSLCGRKISRIRLIGYSYAHNPGYIEDILYEDLTEADRELLPDYPHIDQEIQFSRFASRIDEPMLVEFEDGDTFEIEVYEWPDFHARMSMNCIPWKIGARVLPPNVDAQILFSSCIGLAIKAVEVNTYKPGKESFELESFKDPADEQEIISDITLRFENGTGLLISGLGDFCEVWCIDAQDKTSNISFSELRQGLYDWE